MRKRLRYADLLDLGVVRNRETLAIGSGSAVFHPGN